MSHFAVLVVTDQYPSDEVLTETLQPWHEYECTGIKDQYVVDLDITEEAFAKYSEDTERRFKDLDGGLHSPYDEQFYREPTSEEAAKIGKFGGSGGCDGFSYSSQDWDDGLGYRSKVKFIPEGWEEVTVPTKDVLSFAEWCDGWYGNTPNEEGRLIRTTNPNSKWDWWQVGGRYSNRLMENKLKFGHAISESGNISIKKYLDLPGMKEMRVSKRRTYVEEALADAAARVPADFHLGIDIEYLIKQVADEYPKVRADYEALDPKPAYWAYLDALKEQQPENPVVMARALGMFGYDGLYETGFEPTDTDLEAFIQAAPALSAWAFVKDGEWFQKGQMGWFGLSVDDDAGWDLKFQELLDSVDDNQYLTIVDCHI